MTVTEAPVLLTMADSTDPEALRGLSVDALAGYDNGNWPDFVTIAQENPTKYLLDFTVFLADTGTGGDFEPGDMPAADVVPYVRERHAAGVARPVVYASIDGEMIEIVANLIAAGIPLSSVRLLSAHYGAGKHICGPTTCALGAAATTQMDGTQWTDHADDGSGLGDWDESVLAADFFATETPVSPPSGDPTMSIITWAGQLHIFTVPPSGQLCHDWYTPPPPNVTPVPAGFGWDDESLGSGLVPGQALQTGIDSGQLHVVGVMADGRRLHRWNDLGTPNWGEEYFPALPAA